MKIHCMVKITNALIHPSKEKLISLESVVLAMVVCYSINGQILNTSALSWRESNNANNSV
jgi:ABC-type uncharacterized transport system permease subunit